MKDNLPGGCEHIGTVEGVRIGVDTYCGDGRSYLIEPLGGMSSHFWWSFPGTCCSFSDVAIIDDYTPSQEVDIIQFIRAHYNLIS